MARIFCLMFFFIALCNANESPDNLRLEQVLMLSRHNIRTPLTTNLEIYSPKKWPKFKEPVAHLTKKGALLEGYMGEYFSEWFKSEGFISGCPKQEDVLIYSNTKPRTIDTAKAFAKSAFVSCNISVRHNQNINEFDPLFFPMFHNNSKQFIHKMYNEMEKKLNSTHLTKSYLELNKILNIKNSSVCRKSSLCDLSAVPNEPVLKEGDEPDIKGRLTIGGNIVDSFIMSYYEGFPMEDVAWGELRTDQQWIMMTNLTERSQNCRFDFKEDTKDIARPLLEYMFNIFRNGKPKFTMLVGHDSNLNSVLKAMGFKKFALDNQYEPFPIGGKVVFQKWTDDDQNKYLKVEYIYPSTLQLRSAVKLSMAHPPQRVLLELNHCETDTYGLCPWKDFMNFQF